jgi:hypothetical protein
LPEPIAAILDAYRRTGADGLYGDPRRDHEVGMEGYYWRLTDVAEGRVVVALCGLCASPTGRWALVAVAAHPGGRVRTTVVDAAAGVPDGFGVRAGAAVRASAGAVRFDLGRDAVLDFEIRDPWRWPRRAFGGSGVAHLVPGLGQYWHPHLLGGRAQGELRIAGDCYNLDRASVYAEKNWGPSFPPHWWWGQADAFESGDACVAFAGGPVRVASIALRPTAVVARIGDRVIALRPPSARIVAAVSSASWLVQARSARYNVEIQGEDGGAVTLPMPVSGRRDWELRSHQALGGRMNVVVRRGGRTLFRGESTLAGLERPCA